MRATALASSRVSMKALLAVRSGDKRWLNMRAPHENPTEAAGEALLAVLGAWPTTSAREPDATMSAHPIVILHTDRPAAVLSVLHETHPDLTVHACDSYAGLPDLIERSTAEVVYSVRFDGTPRFPRQALIESPP